MGFGILDNTWLLDYIPLIKKKYETMTGCTAPFSIWLRPFFATFFSISFLITRYTFLECIRFSKQLHLVETNEELQQF